MEQIIAKLLQDFEQGKMNRRQLIKTLALAATAATAARPAVAAVAAENPFKAVTVNHISYQVANYARTRDFYANLLGMGVKEDTGRQCCLTFGNSFLLPRNAPAGVTTPRVDHIAYTVETWEQKAALAKLQKRGLNPIADTPDSYHIKDPDGFDLQISGKNMKA